MLKERYAVNLSNASERFVKSVQLKRCGFDCSFLLRELCPHYLPRLDDSSTLSSRSNALGEPLIVHFIDGVLAFENLNILSVSRRHNNADSLRTSSEHVNR